jgi:TolB protein
MTRPLLAVVACLALAGGCARAAKPGPTGLIAFVSSADDRNASSGEIYVVGADGNGERNLTHNRRPDFAGGWSPDGRQLVFGSSRRGDGVEVYVMGPDGTRLRRVGKGLFSAPSPWSPDGRQILVEPQDTRSQKREVHVLGLDGRQRTLVGAPNEEDIAASWSPGGTHVVFTSTRGGVERIWVVNEDGSARHVVSRGPQDGVAAWSPDGRQIAFLDSNQQLALVDPDGTRLRQLTHAGGTIVDRAFPAWSPDGKQIAFVCDHLGRQICLVAARGGAVRQLTRGREVENDSPVWSPDGQWIAFTSTRDTGKPQIYVVASAGGAPRRITHDNRFDAGLAWQPAG